MLGANVGFGMLMAAVASVLPLIAGRMASGAGGVMISIQHEEFCVIECGRFPAILAMTLGAFRCRAAVNRRRGSGMTGGAIVPDRRVQQSM